MNKIAILGGSGQISKSILQFLKNDYEIQIYSRKSLLKNEKNISYFKLKDFLIDKNIIAIINCAGPGDPNIHNKKNVYKIFNDLDNKIIKIIKKNLKIKYINISTGIVLDYFSKNNFEKEKNSYRLVKYKIEQKHRKLKKLKIYDLRVFGFFSEFIPLNSGFFLSTIINSIKKRKKLYVSSENNIRDYIGGEDLAIFIKYVINSNHSNRSFNLLSKKKVSKFQMLNYLKKHFKLNFLVDKKLSYSNKLDSILGTNKKLKSRYFKPKYGSISLINKECNIILNGKK